ncbi:MAG: DUF123 domain-containing protein [Verrucomicrobia bacterium]|nr:DUF123 domain-containing protein [Verrucomicrobiota bacterium]
MAARLRHHTHVTDRPHWHVDYLRARCVLTSVWLSASPRRLEHAWARTIGRLPGAEAPFPGFGSSDCNCPTHLFWFRTVPACPFPNAGPLPYKGRRFGDPCATGGPATTQSSSGHAFTFGASAATGKAL